MLVHSLLCHHYQPAVTVWQLLTRLSSSANKLFLTSFLCLFLQLGLYFGHLDGSCAEPQSLYEKWCGIAGSAINCLPFLLLAALELIRNSVIWYTDSCNTFSPLAFFDWQSMLIIRFSPCRCSARVCFLFNKNTFRLLERECDPVKLRLRICCSLKQAI